MVGTIIIGIGIDNSIQITERVREEGTPRSHEIWHFFVLAAALCHFISIFFYVI